MRPFILLGLTLLAACGVPYPCCQDGLVDECVCPAGSMCFKQKFQDHGDGTCSALVVDTGDAAE